MKAAFTLDDLPLWPHGPMPESYTPAGIADSIVAALDRHGIGGVYAFSNSWALLDHPEYAAIMDSWVDAGHHVANHTHSHPELNDVEADAYIADIDLAEEHLRPWLSRAPSRFFRYTLNYWGDTQDKLSRVKAHLDDLGLEVAEVTTMFHEWEWNRAYKARLAANDREGIEYLKQSFLDFSVAQLRYDMECARDWFGHEVCGVTLGHNLPFFAEVADDLFSRLIGEGLQFVPLEEAARDPAYDAVCSVVSSEFMVYQQKLAHAAGRPVPDVVPDFRPTYNRIEAMAEGQPY